MRLAMIAACFALAACGGGPVEQAKEAVAAGLKDPASAQFRDVKVCRSGKIVAGEVNAKNAFGGYVGFEPFYYVDGAVVFADQSRFSQLSRECYPRTGKESAREAAALNVADDLESAADELEKAADEATREVQR